MKVTLSDHQFKLLKIHLERCAKQFRKYEDYHTRKGTVESYDKAKVNRELADQTETLIKTLP